MMSPYATALTCIQLGAAKGAIAFMQKGYFIREALLLLASFGLVQTSQETGRGIRLIYPPRAGLALQDMWDQFKPPWPETR